MADTNHGHAGPDIPVEGDGIHYSGIGWFVVVLSVTTLVCMGLMWGMFELMARRAESIDVPRSAIARPVGSQPAQPNLLLDEPLNLEQFRASEQQRLTTYGWIDENGGIVRLPVDRAMDLLLERGLPVRGAQQPPQ